VVGDILTESHGTWTNNPTSFSYQWFDCNGAGNACQPINGATLQTYTIAPADLDHTIAVTETATNAGGSSSPSFSAATGLVHFAPAPRTAGPPAVVPTGQTATSSTTATFSGSVVPNGLATTYHFEYGLDPGYFGGGQVIYGESTPETGVGSDFASHIVSVSASALVPNALYHVRLVATNADGATIGTDQTFRTKQDPQPPPPILGRSFDVERAAGIVLVKLPGAHSSDGSAEAQHPLTAHIAVSKGTGFIPLTEARRLPAGTVLDTRAGTVRLKAAAASRHGKLQTGNFGGALFGFAQDARGLSKGLTTLSLLENTFPGAPSRSSCTSGPAADASWPSAHTVKGSSGVLQTLHASDHGGRFRTRGRYAAATVRGTAWTMSERCDGTLVTVQRGTVSVQNLVSDATVLLRAGHSYFVRAARRP
jgi:hypothetical protein